MRNRLASFLTAAACVLVAAPAYAVTITPAAFSAARSVENFEGIGVGGNVATSAYANILLPGSVSAYTFASGVSVTGPNPGLFANGAFLHNAAQAGAVNTWGANGTVSSAANVPDPWGLASSSYLGSFDSLAAGSAVLDFSFATDMQRVGAWVAGAAGSTITIETYDAANALLETVTIAAPSVASWGTSFLGLERSEGIRRVVFRGADFGLDGLTFEATPLPEPRIGLLILAGLAVAFWRGRAPTGMKTSGPQQNPQRRRDRGTVIVLVTIALGALLSMLSLSLGAAQIYTARGQAQNAADAAALSAMRAFRAGATDAEAVAAGNAIASEHPGQGVPIGASALTLVVGTYDFSGGAFQAGTRFGGRAFQASARVAPRFVLPLFGLESRGVSASAIAAVRRRTVCLAQDVTASYHQSGNFPRALEANHGLLSSMTPADDDPEGAGLPGDTLGIVSFARDSYVHQELTPVQGNSGGLHTAIDRRSDGTGLDPNDRDTLAQDDVAERLCTSGGGPGGRCYGTDIAIGIDRCEELLSDPGVADDTELILVLVSDGVPCLLELSASQRVLRGQQTAVAAADRADATGIHLFSITLDNAAGSGVCTGSDVTFNDSLARGKGRGVTVRDPDDLVTVLGSILRQMPIHLVQ